jgi:hypothetical protein
LLLPLEGLKTVIAISDGSEVRATTTFIDDFPGVPDEEDSGTILIEQEEAARYHSGTLQSR